MDEIRWQVLTRGDGTEEDFRPDVIDDSYIEFLHESAIGARKERIGGDHSTMSNNRAQLASQASAIWDPKKTKGYRERKKRGGREKACEGREDW
jgi:hypothetical protein